MKPQVIDAFMFNNELDILNFRLHELNDYVDKFVIYENSWTFSGNKKPLHFEENKRRFSQFSDKIVHIKSNTRGKDNWKREYAQRYEVLAKGVTSLKLNDKDIVSFCDLDEIIDPKLILNYKEELPQDAPLLVCPHWFNVSWDCYLGAWDHYSVIFSYWGELKKRMNRWKGMQCGWRWDHPKFPKPIRRQELSGWHASWFMKPEDLIVKLQSFAHNGEEWVDELLQNIDIVKDRIQSGFDIQGKKKSKNFNEGYPAYKDYITYD